MSDTQKRSFRKIRIFFDLFIYLLILFLYAYYETHIKEEKGITSATVSSNYERNRNPES